MQQVNIMVPSVADCTDTAVLPRLLDFSNMLEQQWSYLVSSLGSIDTQGSFEV
jgi:hypothetical protein